MPVRPAEDRASLVAVVADREDRDHVIENAARLEVEHAALQVVLSAIAAAAGEQQIAPWS